MHTEEYSLSPSFFLWFYFSSSYFFTVSLKNFSSFMAVFKTFNIFASPFITPHIEKRREKKKTESTTQTEWIVRSCMDSKNKVAQWYLPRTKMKHQKKNGKKKEIINKINTKRSKFNSFKCKLNFRLISLFQMAANCGVQSHQFEN